MFLQALEVSISENDHVSSAETMGQGLAFIHDMNIAHRVS